MTIRWFKRLPPSTSRSGSPTDTPAILKGADGLPLFLAASEARAPGTSSWKPSPLQCEHGTRFVPWTEGRHLSSTGAAASVA